MIAWQRVTSADVLRAIKDYQPVDEVAVD